MEPDGSQFEDNYGSTSGQIGRLKAGQVSAVVSSPPYADSIERPSGIDPDKVKKPGGPNGQTFHRPCGVDGVVSSPPYAGISPEAHGAGIDLGKHYRTYRSQGGGCSFEKFKASRARHQENYGSANGQIGKEKGESYWQAMDAVYRSCYQAIRPGGVIVLVLKDYVSKRKRVPLCDDTAKLLEHIGYTPLERIQAMLVKETRHGDLFQGETVHKKERKSFFRRLHEKKPGAVKIDFEEVLFYRRP